MISSKCIREEIQSIFSNLQNDLLMANSNSWASLILDGWKNIVTKENHLSFLIFFLNQPQNPIYLKNFMIENQSAKVISERMVEIINFLKESNIKPIAIVMDNAP